MSFHQSQGPSMEFIIHWCAKIKDEVETLAYQLNEEAERTERPIRRSKRESKLIRSVVEMVFL
ncbi:UNVERIFIED_CONTAM: hypothetical protein NCL1_31165 [Trichonephila clavipes]